jgi:hypothetical protein
LQHISEISEGERNEKIPRRLEVNAAQRAFSVLSKHAHGAAEFAEAERKVAHHWPV